MATPVSEGESTAMVRMVSGCPRGQPARAQVAFCQTADTRKRRKTRYGCEGGRASWTWYGREALGRVNCPITARERAEDDDRRRRCGKAAQVWRHRLLRSGEVWIVAGSQSSDRRGAVVRCLENASADSRSLL